MGGLVWCKSRQRESGYILFLFFWNVNELSTASCVLHFKDCDCCTSYLWIKICFWQVVIYSKTSQSFVLQWPLNTFVWRWGRVSLLFWFFLKSLRRFFSAWLLLRLHMAIGRAQQVRTPGKKAPGNPAAIWVWLVLGWKNCRAEFSFCFRFQAFLGPSYLLAFKIPSIWLQ